MLFKNTINEEYERLREDYSDEKGKNLISLSKARENKFDFKWSQYKPIKPSFEGIKFFEEISVKDLVDYIDWTPFFNAWGFKSSYP